MAAIPKTLRVLSYAVNGRGVGHLSRLVAINRWIRRYSSFAGVKTQHWFLTTSEADTMLHREGFAGFKMPSKTIVEEAGIAKPDYIALAKQWVWHSVALLRPDILLVDTFPNGSFQELLGVLDLVRHKVLVLRPIKDAYARRGAFRAVAGLYDRIIVPEDPSCDEGLAKQLGMDADSVRYSGPIIRGERFEALERREARRRLGVPEHARCLLVSGGGGGDEGVGPLFDRVAEAVGDDANTWVVLAAGPLFRGPRRGGPRLIWWTTPDLFESMAAFDGAICAGGFNTVHETMLHGIPTVFVPQEKVADDQALRIESLVARGAAMVGRLTDDSLAAGLRAFEDETRMRAMSAAARQAVPHNCARDAAAEVLDLCLPPGLLSRAREQVDGATMERLRRAGATLPELVDLATALARNDDSGERERLDLGPATELLETTAALGMPTSMAIRLAGQLARRFKRPIDPEEEELAEALADLVEARHVRGQWAALSMLVGALVGERELRPPELAAALSRVIDDALNSSVDVLGVARMMLTHAQEFDGRGNAVLFERVRTELISRRTAAPRTAESSR